MNWAHPTSLWALFLVVPAIVSSLLAASSARKHLGHVGGNQVAWQVRTFLRDFSMAGFIILSVMAVAEPRRGRQPITGERSGLDVSVAFDVSRSMLAEDLEPSRLERSTTAFRQVVSSLGDSRFALVPFKGDSQLTVPMTEDRVVVDMWIDRLGPGLSTVPGTNLESALRTAWKSFPSGAGRKRVIIVISDGESIGGHSDRVVQELIDEGLPVYVLAAGTPEGGTIPLEDGSLVKDPGGRPVVSRADSEGLKRLAENTGGTFHDLSRPGSVAELIDSVDGARVFAETRGIRFVGVHRYRSFLIPALALLFLYLAARIMPWRKK